MCSMYSILSFFFGVLLVVYTFVWKLLYSKVSYATHICLECLNPPAINSNSAGTVNVAPMGGSGYMPPIAGDMFIYSCADSLTFELTPNNFATTCQANGEFSLDDDPPSCVQTSNYLLLLRSSIFYSTWTKYFSCALSFTKHWR